MPTRKEKTESAQDVLEALTTAGSAPGKPVVFTCSHPACVVGLTKDAINIVFVGTGGATLPGGTYPLAYRVKGPSGTSFTISAAGATMAPIARTIPAGRKSVSGLQPITV